jgi:anti-sigma regulatory factor (Ser/Thr protein kinase)
MTTDLVTIPQGYSVIAASNIFNKYHYGRLPVVAEPNGDKLVGIVTFSDILSHLLLKINAIAERIEEQERVPTRDLGKREELHFELAPDKFDVAGMASATTKKHLKARGVPPEIVRRIAVICYEAEMNVILHSLGGTMDVDIGTDRVRILVEDEGPGIPDLDKAMEQGYTTANEKIRALGFGAGMGLPNMKRCADQFAISSSMESGTSVEATVFLPGAEEVRQ